MTKSQFLIECQTRTIEPGMALENDELKQALLNRDDDLVLEILDTEF